MLPEYRRYGGLKMSNMRKYKVGVIGGTGMVGQRFVTLMDNHPWFELVSIAASPRSAGKTYEEAVSGRWLMPTPVPNAAKKLVVKNAVDEIAAIAEEVDFVFSAVDMKKDEIKALEERYAVMECPVVSNNSAHRWTPDVPMVIPEVNSSHLEVIEHQRKRLGIRRGFVAVKSNCSLQSYVPALHPLLQFGLNKVLVCTYQAISGAGKNFDMWPEMIDNVIPYIGGEEEKSEKEPLKLWGKIAGSVIENAKSPLITAQCIRVPVSDGHMAAVFASFERKPSESEILECWSDVKTDISDLNPHPLLRNFCIISLKTTARRRVWTGIWKKEWPSPLEDSARHAI